MKNELFPNWTTANEEIYKAIENMTWFNEAAITERFEFDFFSPSFFEDLKHRTEEFPVIQERAKDVNAFLTGITWFKEELQKHKEGQMDYSELRESFLNIINSIDEIFYGWVPDQPAFHYGFFGYLHDAFGVPEEFLVQKIEAEGFGSTDTPLPSIADRLEEFRDSWEEVWTRFKASSNTPTTNLYEGYLSEQLISYCMGMTQAEVELHVIRLETPLSAAEKKERLVELNGLITEASNAKWELYNKAGATSDPFKKKLLYQRTGPASAKHLALALERVHLLAKAKETEEEKWERIRKSLGLMEMSLGHLGRYSRTDDTAEGVIIVLRRAELKKGETVKTALLREIDERLTYAKGGDTFFLYFLKRLRAEWIHANEVNSIPFKLIWSIMADYDPSDFEPAEKIKCEVIPQPFKLFE